MVWIELGTIEPQLLNWQRYPTLVTGGELFRVRQSWVGDWPGTGHLQLSSVYDGAGRYGFRRVGSDTEDRLVVMPVPEELILAGLNSRYIEIKLSYSARVYENANWQVSVDKWTD